MPKQKAEKKDTDRPETRDRSTIMETETAETFGVYTEVTQTVNDNGYRSLVLYTARGDSMFGRSLSAYWNLTVDEAVALGARLIEEAGRARGMDQYERGDDRAVYHVDMPDERLREGQSPRPSRKPIEKRGGYTPTAQRPRPVTPPRRPSDARTSAKPQRCSRKRSWLCSE